MIEFGQRSYDEIKDQLSGNTDQIGQYLQDMKNRSDGREDEEEVPRQRRRCDFGYSSGSDNDDDEHTGMQRERDDDSNTISQSMPILSSVQGGFAQIVYHAGIILKSEVNQFKRLLFRTTKGKVLTKICDNFVINYDVEGRNESNKSNATGEKCVYVLVFQDGSVLKHKVMRICDSFSPDNKRYQLPKEGQATQAEYRDEVVKL